MEGIASVQEPSAGGAVKLGESISMPVRTSLASAQHAQRSAGVPTVGTCPPFVCREFCQRQQCLTVLAALARTMGFDMPAHGRPPQL